MAHWELHLSASPDFTRKGFGRKVKAVGGRFTECRGRWTDKRFVDVPDTPAGRALGDALLARFPYYRKTTVISRGVILADYANRSDDYHCWGNMAWVEVQDVCAGEGLAVARAKCEAAAQNAVARGLVSGYRFAETNTGTAG